MLSYTAADVDALSINDFNALCAALEKYHEREQAEIAKLRGAAP